MLASWLMTDQCPQSLLLSAEEGAAKQALAELSQQLLQAPEDQALVASDTHPDRMWVQPAGTAHRISIEQIRAVADFIKKTPQRGGNKVVIILGLDCMTASAANAFLKSLEEPAPGVYMLCSASRLSAVLPTLRSRCQMFHLPSDGQACSEEISELAQELYQTIRSGAVIDSSIWPEGIALSSMLDVWMLVLKQCLEVRLDQAAAYAPLMDEALQMKKDLVRGIALHAQSVHLYFASRLQGELA